MDSDESCSGNLWFLDQDIEPQYDDDDDDYSITFATLYAEAGISDDDEDIDEDLDLDLHLDLSLLSPNFLKHKKKKNKNADKKKAKKEREQEIENEKIKQREEQKQKENEKRIAEEKEKLKGIDDADWIADFFGPFLTKQAKEPSPPPEPEECEPLPEEYSDPKLIDEWLIQEGINEPLSDIPEYNLLLDLAANLDKNYNILFKVLTPTTIIENSEKECEIMETVLLSPSPPPFELSPERPEILMQSPETVTPAGAFEIDMERPSTSKKALKALSQAGTPKKAVRPLPKFGSFKTTQPVPLEHDNFQMEFSRMVLSSPLRELNRPVMPLTPTNRVMTVKPATPTFRGVMPAMPVTPTNRVMPVTPTNRAMPVTPKFKGEVPVMPVTPRFRVVPAMTGTPTAREEMPAMPRTPSVRAVTSAMPGTPTFKVVKVLPATPRFRGVVPEMPDTPTDRAVKPAMPVTPLVKGVRLAMPATPAVRAVTPAMPGTPTFKVVKVLPATPRFTGVVPAMPGTPTIRAVTPAIPGTPTIRAVTPAIPGTPAVRAVPPGRPGTPAVRKIVKEPETPKQERRSTSKDATKALALANEIRDANNIAALFMSNTNKKTVAKPKRSAGKSLPQWTRDDLPPPVPLVVVPPLPPPVPPPPSTEDDHQMQAWLQLCSSIVVKQVQYIKTMEKKEKNEGKSAEGSILKPSVLGTPTTAILDGEFLGYSKEEGTTLSAKWFQQFGEESANNLRRSVVLPVVQIDPIPSYRQSSRLRIIRRPPKREILSVAMKYTNLYCTVHLKSPLDLRVSAAALDRAVFKHSIDVVQHSIDTIRTSWIWADGTVLIINGFTQEALLEIQQKLVPKLVDLNFKGSPNVEVNYLSLISQTNFSWTFDLLKFSQAETLCGPLFGERHVYYVAKDMPGVVARVHESGEVHVFAMAMDPADAILTALYPILSKYRMTDNFG